MTGKHYAIEHQGKLLTLKELSKAVNVPYPTISGRWQRGDRGERLVRRSDPKFSRTGRW